MIDFALEIPTSKDVTEAHKVFAAKEPRGTDQYWNALGNVQQGFQNDDLHRAANAIAALIKSWNWNHLRFHPEKTARLESDVENLIVANYPLLCQFRARSLASITAADRPTVLGLFSNFADTLGPVGSAKALNLIAPSLFPLWDNAIACEYGVDLSASGYALFMAISLVQIERLAGQLPEGLAPLKTIDEYNYCKFTKKWVS